MPHYVLNLESAFGRDVVDDFVHEYASRPHADSLRALQHVHEVSRPSREGRRDRRDVDRDGPLRAHGRRRAASRRRSFEGSVVLPLGHRPARAAAHAPSGRFADQAGDARHGAPARARAHRREGREPGHLLRARRRSHEDHPPAARRRCARRSRAGPFLLSNGTPVGTHDGFARFTIGQRRGLPGGFREPMFVVAIRPDDRAVVIGPREELLGPRRGRAGRELARRSAGGWRARERSGAPPRRARRPPRSCASTAKRSSSRSTSRFPRSRLASHSSCTTASACSAADSSRPRASRDRCRFARRNGRSGRSER